MVLFDWSNCTGATNVTVNALSSYLELLDNQQKSVCRTAGTWLAPSFESSSNCGQLKSFIIGMTLVDVYPKWFNWFHFIILKGGLLIILIDCMGSSMSNHPIFLDVDTLTLLIFFILSLFVDNAEMINPWKFQPSQLLTVPKFLCKFLEEELSDIDPDFFTYNGKQQTELPRWLLHQPVKNIKTINAITKHSFLAKCQANFLRTKKKLLKANEVIVLGDFAENYQILVQDEIQSYHWSKEYCQPHPLIVHFIDGDGNISHNSLMIMTTIQILFMKYKQKDCCWLP